MTTCIFGIGGGSDFDSAWLLADSDNDIIIVALAPLIFNGHLYLTETLRKYTGSEFLHPATRTLQSNPTYKCYTPNQYFSQPWPILDDSRRANSYGIIVPPPEHSQEFALCAAALENMIEEGARITAVDTGGDCLRGLVPGMGDRDLSDLYGGSLDTRDADAIKLIYRTILNPFPIVILGPGADGETSRAGLTVAVEALQLNESGMELKRLGNVSEYSDRFLSVPSWNNPKDGSTISNICRGMAAVCPDECVPIVRCGRIIEMIPAGFVRSYWVVEYTQGTP